MYISQEPPTPSHQQRLPALSLVIGRVGCLGAQGSKLGTCGWTSTASSGSHMSMAGTSRIYHGFWRKPRHRGFFNNLQIATFDYQRLPEPCFPNIANINLQSQSCRGNWNSRKVDLNDGTTWRKYNSMKNWLLVYGHEQIWEHDKTPHPNPNHFLSKPSVFSALPYSICYTLLCPALLYFTLL